MRNITTDGVCREYADKGVTLTVKQLKGNPRIVLFEGDELAFEFLGKLFLAHAKGIHGCGFEIGPKSAGSAFFSRRAALGLYLHRLPCDNGTANHAVDKKKKSGKQI